MVGCLLLGLFQPIYFSTLVCYIAREKKMAARRETTLVAGCRGFPSALALFPLDPLAWQWPTTVGERENVKSKTIVFPQQRKKKEKRRFFFFLPLERKKASLFSVEAFYFIFLPTRLNLCHELETDFFPRLFSFSRSLASSCSSPHAHVIVFPPAVRSNGE